QTNSIRTDAFKVSKDTPVEERAVGLEVKRSEPRAVSFSHDQSLAIWSHCHSIGEKKVFSNGPDPAILFNTKQRSGTRLLSFHQIKAKAADIGAAADDQHVIDRKL